MLEAVGVGPHEERAYRHLLRHPDCTLADLARHLGEEEHEVRPWVQRLEELGFVSRGAEQPSTLRPTRPDVAVDVLAARGRAELDRAQVAAQGLLQEFRTPEQFSPESLVEVIVGRQAIAARFSQLLQSTVDELLVLDRPPYVANYAESDERVHSLLAEGVAVHGIYSTESLQRSDGVQEAYRAASAGETSRMHPAVPMKLVVSDRSLAVLPLSLEESGNSALVVHGSALLEALVGLFWLLWDQAVPVAPGDGDQEDPPIDPRLMTLLAGGLKDDAIARQFAVSSRTIGRRVAELMDTIGARTRFQAGVHAQQRNLLGPRDDAAAGNDRPEHR